MVIRSCTICLNGVTGIFGNIYKIRNRIFLECSLLCWRTGYSCTVWDCLLTCFSFNILGFGFWYIFRLLLFTEQIICWFTISILNVCKYVHWLWLFLLRYFLLSTIHECIYQWTWWDLIIRGFTAVMVDSKEWLLLFILLSVYQLFCFTIKETRFYLLSYNLLFRLII